MRTRALDAAGDVQFGMGPSEFFVDSPDCVAQAVLTRLKLVAGEWFLDQTEGLPYFGRVLGERTQPLYDQAIRERILATPGVLAITEYASVLDAAKRALSVNVKIQTTFDRAAGSVTPIPGVTVQPGRLDIDFVLDQSVMT